MKIYILLIALAALLIRCDCEPDPCEGLPCPDCPVVESIEPSEVAAGDKVIVKGENFQYFGLGNSDEITVGGIPVNWTGEITDTTIHFEVPSRAVSGKVRVCAGKEKFGLNGESSFVTLCSDDYCDDRDVELGIVFSCTKTNLWGDKRWGGVHESNADFTSCRIGHDKYVMLWKGSTGKIVFTFLNESNGGRTGNIERRMDSERPNLHFSPTNVLEHKNGGFVVVGNYQEQVGSHTEHGMFFIGFDENGIRVLAPTYHHNTNLGKVLDFSGNVAGEFKVTATNVDGGYYVFNLDERGKVIDNTGEKLFLSDWQFAFEHFTPNVLLKEVKDKTVLAGFTKDIQGKLQTITSVLNEEGLLLDSDYLIGESPIDIVSIDESNEFLQLSTIITGSNQSDTDIRVSKCSIADGGKVRCNYLHEFSGGKIDEAVKIIRGYHEDEYLILGVTNSLAETAHRNLLLISINYNGDEKWVKEYPIFSQKGNLSKESLEIFRTEDYGYMITGKVGNNPFTLKLNCRGEKN